MKSKQIFFYTIFIISLLLLWQYMAQCSDKVRLLVSSPLLVLDFFKINISKLLEATFYTFIEAFAGLLIATTFSFTMMVICLYVPKLMKYVLPVMVVSQIIPLITLAPLFIILFGLGIESKIMMATLMCFFPIFVNFSNGIKLISKNIQELMFVYNATNLDKIRYMYFPLALPSIISGLKIASTLAVIGAIVGEFNGTEIGIGKNLFIAAKRLEPELMMSSLFLSSLLGGLFYISIVLIEKKFGKWYLK
ncbi:ABC transporter permease [Flavobacterium sp.]|jgi:NitT/TauT family transport system permease protein|uniref:ABC transporter permease n=1 Tax=Flavobacterium sp. TaxID=239 RepID=UPI0037BF3E00